MFDEVYNVFGSGTFRVCHCQRENDMYDENVCTSAVRSVTVLYNIIYVFSSRRQNRARQLYKNISMLFLFPVTRDLLFTNT